MDIELIPSRPGHAKENRRRLRAQKKNSYYKFKNSHNNFDGFGMIRIACSVWSAGPNEAINNQLQHSHIHRHTHTHTYTAHCMRINNAAKQLEMAQEMTDRNDILSTVLANERKRYVAHWRWHFSQVRLLLWMDGCLQLNRGYFIGHLLSPAYFSFIRFFYFSSLVWSHFDERTSKTTCSAWNGSEKEKKTKLTHSKERKKNKKKKSKKTSFSSVFLCNYRLINLKRSLADAKML